MLGSIQQKARNAAGNLGVFKPQLVLPLILFIVAFVIRAAYLLQSEHRVLQFGDAFYYLTTGTELAKAIASSSDWHSLFQQLTPAAPLNQEDNNSFLSVELPMRLVLDGPIYPGYLALVASLCGFAAQAKPQFDSYCLPVGMANAVIDSLSCLLIYHLGSRAFGQKVGAVAGLLWAAYPAASINLARAYSEQFAYFLVLALLSTALLAREGKLKLPALAATSFLFGLLVAAVTLARPVFVLVVGVVVLALLFSDWFVNCSSGARWYQSWCGKRRLTALVLSVLGAAFLFLPWAQITTKSLGKPAMLVSRAPAYNLFVGNQVVTDGWKTWPLVPGYTGDLKSTVSGILENFAKQPFEMVALQFKKLPRLWAGGWNEFRYPFFGLSFQGQNIWHCMCLLLGFVGVCLTAARIRAQRELTLTFVGIAGLLIIGVHFMYVAFEPISRYSLTAMPFVQLFAAVAIVALLKSQAHLSFALLAIFAFVLFGILQGHATAAPIILQNFPNLGIMPARLLEQIAILALWFVLGHFVIRAIGSAKGSPVVPQSRFIIMLCFALASLSWFSAAHFDRSRTEWYCDLRAEMQTVSQEQALPQESDLAAWLSETKDKDALNPMNTAFLLVDFEHDMGQPGVVLTVNRTTWRTVAMPWYQVLGKEGDIPTIMNMQGSAMGKDWRSFRQWWAIPIPRGLLKAGKPNEIAIGFVFAEAPLTVRVFGDYFASDDTENMPLPSLELFSWTRGFATYDVRDTRVYELTPGLSKITNPALWFNKLSESTDLSTESGLQVGAYRIRIAIPRSPGTSQYGAAADVTASAPASAKFEALTPQQFEDSAPTTIAKKLEDVTIIGADPTSYMLFKESKRLPADLKKGAIVDFGCLLKTDRKRQSGPIVVIFEGTDANGNRVKWSSPWQPTMVSCDANWRRFHASYVVPDHMLAMKDLAVNVMFNVFSIDELFTNKRKALGEVLMVRDSNITLYAPLKMPPGKKLDWLIF